MLTENKPGISPGRCDACGREQGPLLKLSLGKDFFGRPYDRLSPALDQSPKWYCETCSMHKNLQRDFRDIRAELDLMCASQPSQLNAPEQLQRAQLRLREISAILDGHVAGTRLLDQADVKALIHRLQSQPASPAVPG